MDRDTSQLLIHELFEERARRNPQGIALHEGSQSITFSELESRATGAAAGLLSRGLGHGCSVGLHLERSIDWVVSLLAILKANASVAPLPPSNPAGWLRDILEFSKLDAVVHGVNTPLDPSLPVVSLPLPELRATGGSPIPSPGQPSQAAFVLCSSGSTGRPKMIVRSHRSFFHRLQWTWEEHPFEAGEVACQKAHMTTTHAIYELFEPLLAGVPVVIIPDETVRNLDLFWETVRKGRISRLLIVPSALRASLDMPGFEPPPLKILVLMGEYVPPGLAERTVRAFSPATRIYSIYGSTEASSTLVSDLRVWPGSGEELPLGNPISQDIKPLILGPDLNPVGPGEVGRLHMAGAALFSGYFRDPTLTDSVLVEVPGFSEPVYDTQDQVRRMPTGEVQFIGRVGDTVKIRGFRVDLPEVERAMLLTPGVRQATVAVTDRRGGGAALAGFFLPSTVNRASVFETLREQVPAYMVPSTLVGLDNFPLTKSGKVDRVRILEEFEGREPGGHHDREITTTESRVRDVWEVVLGHSNFEPHDSFFEVGGDSLSVFSLVHSLHDVFGLQVDQLAEPAIYGTPTIEGLAQRIDRILSGHSEGGSQPAPILVTLRKGSDAAQPPLFLISSAGGTLGAYQKLSKALKTPREIIGVRDPFTWGERDPTEGFQSWVGLYLQAIRARQSQGPYSLCAYSTAGALGYEIARRLRQDGEEVALLALVDPLALDRSSGWSYGYWALRATYMRPAFREVVKLWGRLRRPAVWIWRAVARREVTNDHAFSAKEAREIAEYALRSKRHLKSLSALLELNTGLPFSLSEDDFSGKAPGQYLSILQSRVLETSPDVDPDTIERIAVQYELQVRTQHAYRLPPFDGRVLLVEPATRYRGLLEAQLRPHARNMRARAVELAPPSERTREICGRFGSLEPHFRCMRDDRFVQGLAEELDPFLG